jgi:hypothetical protein
VRSRCVLDADGYVLKPSRTAIAVRIDDRLCTPPADGRILPSITARGADAGHLTLDDLGSTDDIYVPSVHCAVCRALRSRCR